MMLKMDKLMGIFFVLVVIVAVFFLLEPVNSDFVVYEPSFDYNESLVNVNGSYSLLPIIETITLVNETKHNSFIISAFKNGKNKTINLQTLDNDTVNIQNKSKIFDITFDHELNNNDEIKFYVKGKKITDVFLCDPSTLCDPPGYGLFNYTGEKGWYTIIISNLENSTNSFNIDPKKIKFDYIYAVYTEVNYYNITNITYPESATLISDFIEPENLFSFGLLERNEELNNQSILYEYLTNENWSLIEDFNLSYVDSPKIKFRITLQSDTQDTPILYNLSLNYYLKEDPPESSGGIASNKQVNTINMESYRKVTVPVKLSGIMVKSLKKTKSSGNLITGEVVRIRTHTKFSTYVNTVLLIMLSISGILCYISFRKKNIFKSNRWFKFKKKK